MGSGYRTPLATAALLSIALVWGLSFVLVQDGVERMAPLDFLAWRFVPAAAIVALLFLGPLRELPPAGWRRGALLGLLLAAVFVLQAFALARTSVSNAGFITGLYVAFTPLLIRWWWREHVPALVWLGAGGATIGLILLAGVGARPNAGDGLVLVSALALALYILQTDRAVRDFSAPALSASQLLVCAGICVAAAPLFQELTVPSHRSAWTAIAVTAVVATALGIAVQAWAQQHVPPARVAVILSCEPAFGGLFGVVLAGDRLAPPAWGGAALISLSVLAVEGAALARGWLDGRARRRPRPSAVAPPSRPDLSFSPRPGQANHNRRIP
jgi:drug/metabolite transporter (DMT)-like permease